MAIKRLPDGRTVIVPEGIFGYDDVRLRIQALLTLLSSTTEEGMLDTEMVYYTCQMIIDMLPSMEDFETLDRVSKGQ